MSASVSVSLTLCPCEPRCHSVSVTVSVSLTLCPCEPRCHSVSVTVSLTLCPCEPRCHSVSVTVSLTLCPCEPRCHSVSVTVSVSLTLCPFEDAGGHHHGGRWCVVVGLLGGRHGRAVLHRVVGVRRARHVVVGARSAAGRTPHDSPAELETGEGGGGLSAGRTPLTVGGGGLPGGTSVWWLLNKNNNLLSRRAWS